MTVLFREIVEGQSFKEDGEVFLKIGPNRGMNEKFDILTFYGEDEIELVSDPEDMLFVVRGQKVLELEG